MTEGPPARPWGRAMNRSIDVGTIQARYEDRAFGRGGMRRRAP